MVPAVWHSLAALPLSANGKIDRKALPLSLDAAQASTPAETPTEVALIEMWKSALNVEAIGSGDNFFGLGGDSLVAVRLLGQMRYRFLSRSAGSSAARERHGARRCEA